MRSSKARHAPLGLGLLGGLVAGLGAAPACTQNGGAPASEPGPGALRPALAAERAPPKVDCAALIPPDRNAACDACYFVDDPCQANGCFGGYFCDEDQTRCVPPPGACSPAADAGAPPPPPSDAGAPPAPADAGAPPDAGATGMGGKGGAIGPAGGTLDALSFAIVGDTRPASIDDTKLYPTAVIQQIWMDVQAETPRPPFALTTGDYLFARPTGAQAAPQLDLYLGAQSAYQNIVFHALGNHECTGATTSNCGEGGDTSNNYDAFMARMIAPLGHSTPYFVVRISAADQRWTAKFIFTAANAWGPQQAAWLKQVIAEPTTYTFVVRHERSTVTTAPGVSPIDAIIGAYPVTMLIVGHTHTFQYVAKSNEIVVGNGGAPLSGSVNYGYVIARQRADGAIVFQAKDYQTRGVIQTIAVHPDGSAAD